MAGLHGSIQSSASSAQSLRQPQTAATSLYTREALAASPASRRDRIRAVTPAWLSRPRPSPKGILKG